MAFVVYAVRNPELHLMPLYTFQDITLFFTRKKAVYASVTPKILYNDATKRDSNAPMSQLDSHNKIVKVSSLTNEEKVLGADVALPIVAVDEISVKFANTLYGYFIGSWLAFLIVENYVRNACVKYGFESFIRSMPIMLNTWTANTKLKMEDSTKVPVWIKVHSVPVVAFSEIGTYARALIKLYAERAIKDSVVVSIPFSDGSGRSLETLKVEYEWRPYRCSNCKIFDHDDKFCPARAEKAIPGLASGNGGVSKIGRKGNMPSNRQTVGKHPYKAKQIQGIRFAKPKSKLVYRPVSKPTRVDTKDTTSHALVDVQVVDKPCEYPDATMDAIPYVKGTSIYIQDAIDLGQLKENMDRLMEENKVLDINTDFGLAVENSFKYTNEVSNNAKSVNVEVNGNEKGSLLDQFLKSRKNSKSKHISNLDSDESEVEEVCILDGIPGGGFLGDLEDDLDCYGGYEAPVYDLTEQEQAICNRYDIRLWLVILIYIGYVSCIFACKCPLRTGMGDFTLISLYFNVFSVI
ncbi:zinc knuckle CX2CX4HX4C containing protein [Tanacetum coccineum]